MTAAVDYKGFTALIDFGAGNLHSVHNALAAAGAKDIRITSDPETILTAERVVLPGVGAFSACAAALRAVPGMIEALNERVLMGGAPFLGICVGMQLLADFGLEHGRSQGLGWIGGEIAPIMPGDSAIKVPHMGWNDVVLPPKHMDERSEHAGRGAELMASGEAYFLHSYKFMPSNSEDIAAYTDHGGPVVAAVARGNILGVQFHPEKSQAYGLALLQRFLKWQP